MERAKKHVNPVPEWAAATPVTWVLRNAARDGLLEDVASQLKLGCPVDSPDVVRANKRRVARHTVDLCSRVAASSPAPLSRCCHLPACGAQNGHTALLLAAEAGHTEVVQALLDAGADTEARTKVRFVLIYALARSSLELLPSLLRGVGPAGWADTVPRELHARPRCHGRGAPERRCQSGCCRCELDIVPFLARVHDVRLYACVALLQKWHNTGMMRAVDRDYVEVVEMIGACQPLCPGAHTGFLSRSSVAVLIGPLQLRRLRNWPDLCRASHWREAARQVVRPCCLAPASVDTPQCISPVRCSQLQALTACTLVRRVKVLVPSKG